MSCTSSLKLKNKQQGKKTLPDSLSRCISINCSPLGLFAVLISRWDISCKTFVSMQFSVRHFSNPHLAFQNNSRAWRSLVSLRFLRVHIEIYLALSPIPHFSIFPRLFPERCQVAPRLSVKWHRRRLLVSTHLMGLGHRKESRNTHRPHPPPAVSPDPHQSAAVCHFYNYFCYF